MGQLTISQVKQHVSELSFEIFINTLGLPAAGKTSLLLFKISPAKQDTKGDVKKKGKNLDFKICV